MGLLESLGATVIYDLVKKAVGHARQGLRTQASQLDAKRGLMKELADARNVTFGELIRNEAEQVRLETGLRAAPDAASRESLAQELQKVRLVVRRQRQSVGLLNLNLNALGDQVHWLELDALNVRAGLPTAQDFEQTTRKVEDQLLELRELKQISEIQERRIEELLADTPREKKEMQDILDEFECTDEESPPGREDCESKSSC